MPEKATAGGRPPTSEDEIRAYTVGDIQPHAAPINLVDYDPAWPALFEREEQRIREALGDQVVRLEHTGSTSVPGLAAKPIIDMTLIVAELGRRGHIRPPARGRRLRPPHPRAALVRASRPQGAGHERQSPRVFAGQPGARSDGRLPRLAPDPR